MQVTDIARTWIGTPFHHQARLKGVGVDCIGLIIGVARELGVVAPDFDIPAYPRIPDGTTLLEMADLHMTRVDDADMQEGDVIVIKFRKYPQHFGIVGQHVNGGWSIIHSDALEGRVLEVRLMFSTAMQHVATYRIV